MKTQNEKIQLSNQEFKVFKLFKEISKKYESYLQMSKFSELKLSDDYEEIPLHDWSTPLNLVIRQEE